MKVFNLLFSEKNLRAFVYFLWTLVLVSFLIDFVKENKNNQYNDVQSEYFVNKIDSLQLELAKKNAEIKFIQATVDSQNKTMERLLELK